MTLLLTIGITLVGALKLGLFAISVRNAVRPRPLPIPEEPTDPDGPDDGWRWWEEFELEPEPTDPGGSLQPLLA